MLEKFNVEPLALLTATVQPALDGGRRVFEHLADVSSSHSLHLQVQSTTDFLAGGFETVLDGAEPGGVLAATITTFPLRRIFTLVAGTIAAKGMNVGVSDEEVDTGRFSTGLPAAVIFFGSATCALDFSPGGRWCACIRIAEDMFNAALFAVTRAARAQLTRLSRLGAPGFPPFLDLAFILCPKQMQQENDDDLLKMDEIGLHCQAGYGIFRGALV